ncbi:MAG: PilT/PilU family type 4a pilus ATPase [bacterium]
MNKIDELFEILLNEGGSDLHLKERRPPKIRKSGAIAPIREELLTREEMLELLQPLPRPAVWKQFMETGDADFAYDMENRDDARFRANYYRHIDGIGAVFRMVPSQIKTLDELGIPKVVKTFGDLESGLVLVTGPTGSGKSTTLAAILDYINTTYSKHVITIEDPIEFVYKNKKSVFTQREIPHHSPNFFTALKDAVRSDSNVVMVSDLRDLETMSMTLTAANMGLLVFGTLHTNNASKTIDRIIDIFPSERQAQTRTMLAHCLRGVCAQLLLKRHDGRGRIAVNEILIANQAVEAIIREGANARLVDIMMTGKQMGMQLMDDAIADLFERGVVNGQEAYMKAIDKERFANYFDMQKEFPAPKNNNNKPSPPAPKPS